MRSGLKYQVFNNDKLHDLEQEIDRAFVEGWTLHGGLVIEPAIVCPDGSLTAVFYNQVMLKNIPEQE